MSRYGTHRQHRAAKKKTSICRGHEIYLTKKQLHKIICVSAGTAVLAYLKGISTGYMICKAMGKNNKA